MSEMSVVFPFERDVEEMRGTAKIRPFSVFNSNTARGRNIIAVVAAGRNGEIGFEGDMPWHIPEDLRHFKELTLGHPVIMGRSTWLSIPRRPLPGRRNIVLTRRSDFEAEGAEISSSIEKAIALCEADEIPVIIGGGSVYAEVFPYLSQIYITRIDADFPQADTFFPTINPDEWTILEQGDWLISKSGLRYRFETLVRSK